MLALRTLLLARVPDTADAAAPSRNCSAGPAFRTCGSSMILRTPCTRLIPRQKIGKSRNSKKRELRYPPCESPASRITATLPVLLCKLRRSIADGGPQAYIANRSENQSGNNGPTDARRKARSQRNGGIPLCGSRPS